MRAALLLCGLVLSALGGQVIGDSGITCSDFKNMAVVGSILKIFSSKTREDVGVDFFLSTTEQRQPAELSIINWSALQSSGFDPTKRTYIVIHGYKSGGRKSWVLDLKDKLLDAYFAESVGNAANGSCKFNSHRWNGSYEEALEILNFKKNNVMCNDCPEMGINASKLDKQGTYLVLTSIDEPYCVARCLLLENTRTYANFTLNASVSFSGNLISARLSEISTGQIINHVLMRQRERERENNTGALLLPHGMAAVERISSYNPPLRLYIYNILYPWDGSYEDAIIAFKKRKTGEFCSDCPEMGINASKSIKRGNFIVITAAESPYCGFSDKDQVPIMQVLGVNFLGKRAEQRRASPAPALKIIRVAYVKSVEKKFSTTYSACYPRKCVRGHHRRQKIARESKTRFVASGSEIRLNNRRSGQRAFRITFRAFQRAHAVMRSKIDASRDTWLDSVYTSKLFDEPERRLSLFSVASNAEYNNAYAKLHDELAVTVYHKDESIANFDDLRDRYYNVIGTSEMLRLYNSNSRWGRINHANIPYDQKHPLLLLSRNFLTDLIIRHFHEIHHHAGELSTLYNLRLYYWTIGGRNQQQHRRGSAKNRTLDLPRTVSSCSVRRERERAVSLSRALYIQTRPDDFRGLASRAWCIPARCTCAISNSGAIPRTRCSYYYYCRSLECKGRARSSANFAILLSSYLYPGTGTPSSESKAIRWCIPRIQTRASRSLNNETRSAGCSRPMCRCAFTHWRARIAYLSVHYRISRRYLSCAADIQVLPNGAADHNARC
ncbi:unnamed protein product [Trichogramma brassicae]|uniref:Uncharacterized protein n=1 Tax=Trichogramma brassicae TaxID=86971 RepID=A0A6H5IQG8_9HYME|nr:unnamed protein product [Trichogramma brassicae]